MRNAFALKRARCSFWFSRVVRKKPREMRPGGRVWKTPRALESGLRPRADPVACPEPSARVSRRSDDPSPPPPPFLILTDVSLPPFFIFLAVRAQASGAASSLDTMGGKVRANLPPRLRARSRATPAPLRRLPTPRGRARVPTPAAPSGCRTARWNRPVGEKTPITDPETRRMMFRFVTFFVRE
jgi:hypothetical protein